MIPNRLRKGIPALTMWLLAGGGPFPMALGADADLDPRSPIRIPPPAPPTVVTHRAEVSPLPRLQGFGGEPAGQYSIGEPSDEEQLYVEYINRARANPTEEGIRLVTTTDPEVLSAYGYFKVDLELVKRQFAAIAPAPPVSIHPFLTDSARRHSEDMYQNEFQGHDGTDGSDAGRRMTEAGYTWRALGENVFSYAESVWYGHAGLNVDWGLGPGGLQNPPGHRNTIHNPLFREVGVGVRLGSKGSVGPQLVTQDFGTRQNLGPFITGVAFYDLNTNGFYDLGEGMGGVKVWVTEAPSYAVSSRSGGFSVPVPGNGHWTVIFEVGGVSSERKVLVSEDENAKTDYKPQYSPPEIQGPSTAALGRDTAYSIRPLLAANRHDWRVVRRVAWAAPEGAEAGLGPFEANVSSGYSVTDTAFKQSGSASFHLAQPDPPQDQYLTLRRPLRLGATSELRFWSRLGVATTNQVARVQYSIDSGLSWRDLWSQRGKGPPGESRFTEQRVPLSSLAGATIGLRLVYDYEGGSYYPQVEGNLGWRIDDIVITNADQLEGEVVSEVPTGTTFAFRPAQQGSYLLQVRGRIDDRVYPWGPGFEVTAQEGGPLPAEVRMKSIQPRSGGGWEIRWTLQAGDVAGIKLEGAASATGPWSTENQATIEATGVAGEYRSLVPSSGAGARFYRTVSR
ncbi:MAG: CAP domain-containing protein [Verrucomicrobiales bacterium]|nr:CAP domain-containing protein [Verrucomicrobiales bacterium]